MPIIYISQQVYQDGVNNIRVGYILRHLAYPAVASLILIIAVPYAFANGLVPLIAGNEKILFLRGVYHSSEKA